MFAQRLVAARHHLGREQSGNDAVLFRDVAADRQPRALFSADGDFVLFDQLADVLEAYRRLVQFDLVMPRQGIDEVGGGDGFGYAVLQPRVSTR